MSQVRLHDYSRSRAVLIGVSRYDNAILRPLRAASNSLRGMRQILADPTLCGWPGDRITEVLNPRSARDVAYELNRLARETYDVLLVYYVGHGQLTARGELCLTLSNTDPSEPLVTALPYDWVRRAFLDSPARVRVAILDCCRSGRAIETLADEDLADSAEVAGVFTLTAATGNDAAHVPPPDRQAVACTTFTGELIDLVRSGIPAGPPQLTLSTIYIHLRTRLRARGFPQPNQRGTDTAGQFVLCRNIAASTPRVESQRTEPNVHGSHLTPKEHAIDRPASRRVRRRTFLLTASTGLAAVGIIPGSTTGTTTAASQTPSDAGKPATSAAPDVDRISFINGAGLPRVTATLTARPNGVRSAVFSPDGRTLATSGNFDSDASARLWDLGTGSNIMTLTGHEGNVRSVAFSPYGDVLATGGWDATTRLWYLETRFQFLTVKGHASGVTSVAFNPDGNMLATGSWDKTVRLWTLHTGASIAVLDSHTSGVTSVAFSPDGNLLATAGDPNGAVRLWDVRTGRLAKTLNGHTDSVNSVAFNREGILATGSSDRDVRLWDVARGKSTATFSGHAGSIKSVAFSSDGKTLASGGLDSEVRLWDMASGRSTGTLKGHIAGVTTVAFSPDGKTLAACLAGSGFQLWLWAVR